MWDLIRKSVALSGALPLDKQQLSAVYNLCHSEIERLTIDCCDLTEQNRKLQASHDHLHRILARIADKGIQIKGLTITVNWSAKLQQKADKEGKLKVLMEEVEKSLQ